MSIRSWLEPLEPPEGVAVVFDVFRCSTTIHTLVARNVGPVHVARSLQDVAGLERVRNMRVFSELSQPVDCLERFDNSPYHANISPWDPEVPALVATTTGTPAMFAARNFQKVYVGSLVNFSTLVMALSQEKGPITLIPAAFPEAKHVEDEITAQAVATALEGFANLPDFVKQCADQAKDRILASGRPDFLTHKLPTGGPDVTLAMEIDRFPQLLTLSFEEGAPFAQVRRHD